MRNLFISLLYGALLTQCLLFPSKASAQCSFTLNAKVVQHSTCASNGIINVNLSGTEVDLAKIQILLSNGAEIDMVSTTNNRDFTTLPKGNYTITANTVCKATGNPVTQTANLTINSSYKDPVAYIADYRKSLNCQNTGMIPIVIMEGKAPYTITAVSTPEGYTGNYSLTVDNPGTTAFDNLPPGAYSFNVKDECSYEVPLSMTLTTVASDFPSDPYYPYLYPLRDPAQATGCNQALIAANEVSEELEYYWNLHRDKFYEVSYTVNGNTSAWESATSYVRQMVTLPHTFKEIRDNNYPIDINLRVKNCTAQKMNTDNINIYPHNSLNFNYQDANCDAYSLWFLPSYYYNEDIRYDRSYHLLICYPYSWEFHGLPDNSLVEAKTGINTADTQKVVTRLEYEKDYRLTITDNSGSQFTYAYRNTKRPYTSYGYSRCMPNPFYISWGFGLNGGKFKAGSRFRQTGGPTQAIHRDTILTEDIDRFYPFATKYDQWEPTAIANGTYTFEYTNTCGDPPFELQFVNINHELRDFGYTTAEGCDGLHVYPAGQLYEGAATLTTYFKMIKAPEDVDISNSQFSAADGRYFVLPKTGHYTFQASYYYDGCPVDTIGIDYVRENFSLDSRAVYLCNPGDMPLFYLRAQHGVTPYTYDLYENNTRVAGNNTGEFNYGDANQNYSIKVTDNCGKNFTTQLQVIDLTHDLIINASSKVCLGSTISLNSMSLGATSFQWTGPNFNSSLQNDVIENATPADAGTYTLTFQPVGCAAPVSQSVNVEVYATPAPVYPDTVYSCVNETFELPAAAPLTGHTFVWFTADGDTLATAPDIATGQAHEAIYYVAQKEDGLGCIGPKQKVVFLVRGLPSSTNIVEVDRICFNTAPIFVVRSSYPDFVYSIYSDAQASQLIYEASGTGNDLYMNLPDPISQSTNYYTKIKDLYCESTVATITVPVKEIKIFPDRLPSYRRAVYYEQEFSSDAVTPVFSLADGRLPEGLLLSPSGLLSGTARPDDNTPEYNFTVEVRDINNCPAYKDYILSAEMYMSKIFTPNNDGINDVFMAGHKLLIVDRMGIIIYEGPDGWDGTCKGQPAAVDIYFYKVYVPDESGVTTVKTGYVGIER